MPDGPSAAAVVQDDDKLVVEGGYELPLKRKTDFNFAVEVQSNERESLSALDDELVVILHDRSSAGPVRACSAAHSEQL